MTPGTGWQPDDEFLNRVKRAYRLSIAGWAGAGRSMWSDFFKRQQPIHLALLSEQNVDLRAIFSDPGATDLFYGVDNLIESCIAERQGIQAGSDAEIRSLISLGAAALANGAEELEAFDKALGHRVQFPNPFRGEFGEATDRGIASFRAIQALYQATRIRSSVAVGGRVMEIGPGMGRTAFYAYKAGVTDYTTLDLPIGVVAQACFLGSVLGPDQVWLVGDAPEDRHGRIKILPGSLPLPDDRFDLVLNVDSMTEMDARSALRYAQWIAGHADRFLSVNHGFNLFTVRDVCQRAFDVKNLHEQPYPLRSDYSEQLFEPGQARPSWLARAGLEAEVLNKRIMLRLTR